MNDKVRIKIATFVTVLFLAAISAAGVVAHTSRPPVAVTTVTHATASGASRGPSHANPASTWHEQEHE